MVAILASLGAGAAFAWPRGEPEPDVRVAIADLRANGGGLCLTGVAVCVSEPAQGEFIAYARSTHPHFRGNDCGLQWWPQFLGLGPAAKDGIFRSPCGGDSYDPRGDLIFGPGRGDLDRVPFSVDGGELVVDLGRVCLANDPACQ